MAAKRVPVAERRIATIVHLLPETRLQIEQVADRQRVSISEVGRKAIEQVVQRQVLED